MNRDMFKSKQILAHKSTKTLCAALNISEKTFYKKCKTDGFSMKQVDVLCSELGICSDMEKAEIFLS